MLSLSLVFVYKREVSRGGLWSEIVHLQCFFLDAEFKMPNGDNGQQQQQGGGGAALTQLSIRVHPMLGSGGGTPRRRLSSASRGKCLAAV